MKVIVAGYPKTGTKSMRAALKELGYNVYDYMENYNDLGNEWTKILLEGGTTEDFRRMFENVDAVTDLPGCYFWDEIHKAFPEAKIILTMRSSEDEWCNSLEKFIEVLFASKLQFLLFLSPTEKRLVEYSTRMWRLGYGTQIEYGYYRKPKYSMILMRMAYRRHNSHVLQTAPKDKLLVFNVKDGWEPLCKFLDVDVPDKPFPHDNIQGSVVEEFKNHPVRRQARRETIINRSLLFLALGLGFYFVISGKYLSIF